MYKVKVKKRIWKDEKEIQPGASGYQYELSTPFPPFIGLSIIHEGWQCSPIISVTWVSKTDLNGKEYFECWVEDEKPGMYGDSYLSHEDLKQFAIEDSWEGPEIVRQRKRDKANE